MDRIPFVRRAILADRSTVENIGWTAVAIVVPAALRYAVDSGASGIPFVSFFPAVLVTSVVLGWRYGAATALISGILANRLFRPDPVLFSTRWEDVGVVALFLLSCAIIIDAGAMLRRLVRENEAAKQRSEALNQELMHRGKNIFTVVQSLARLSARHSPPEKFVDAFADRLDAMSKAHELLRIGESAACEIGTLVGEVVGPFRTDGNIAIEGPKAHLPQQACVPLALALHELCTNATKYGALSCEGGNVTIAWQADGEHKDCLLLTWKERGGPSVETTSRTGMGSLLLRAQPGLRDVRLYFRQHGVECEVVIEAAR